MVTHRLRQRDGGGAHPVVAGERGGAVLRRAEPGRTELLPAHVGEACTPATHIRHRYVNPTFKKKKVNPGRADEHVACWDED